MKSLVVFASGSGSNAENLVQYFREHSSGIQVKACFCNQPEAGVIRRMHRLGIPTIVFNKSFINDKGSFEMALSLFQPDLIVLAGYLWLFPSYLVEKYRNKTINIHPALLPKFGGKGMYGDKVHQAVIDSAENKSGITIHYVNEQFDEGAVIKQVEIPVGTDDTVDSLKQKIHRLEFEHLPMVIEEMLR